MRGGVRELISRFRIYFLFAGLFSLVINALLLVPAIYMTLKRQGSAFAEPC